MFDTGMSTQVVVDIALKGACRRKVELGVHSQGVKPRGQRLQIPQVAVAQTAIGVQTDFDDAWMQAVVQKMGEGDQYPSQHAPVDGG